MAFDQIQICNVRWHWTALRLVSYFILEIFIHIHLCNKSWVCIFHLIYDRCTDGYYGNPLVAGGFCQPCDCSSNHEIGSSDWCDRLTGQCLKCKTGTAGHSCQLCATGYYGNATEGTCQGENVARFLDSTDETQPNEKKKISKNEIFIFQTECRCYSQGSASNQCDMETGQCQCRDRFVGKHCNRCRVIVFFY